MSNIKSKSFTFPAKHIDDSLFRHLLSLDKFYVIEPTGWDGAWNPRFGVDKIFYQCFGVSRKAIIDLCDTHYRIEKLSAEFGIATKSKSDNDIARNWLINFCKNLADTGGFTTTDVNLLDAAKNGVFFEDPRIEDNKLFITLLKMIKRMGTPFDPVLDKKQQEMYDTLKSNPLFHAVISKHSWQLSF
jgi:hypothetical protein